MNNLQFVDSGREYNDIQETFVRDVREQEKVWLENSLVPKLRKVFTQDGSATDTEFKVLAVGSGVGSLDCLFCHKPKNRNKREHSLLKSCGHLTE